MVEEEEEREMASKTPNPTGYEIADVTRVRDHLVMKVLYPNCIKCAYEGNKIMVFLNVSEADALRWRRIDPHFRAPTQQLQRSEAPSPAARFPASDEGWLDAVEYARSKR